MQLRVNGYLFMATKPDKDTWVHIAMEYGGSSGGLIAHNDGVEVGRLDSTNWSNTHGEGTGRLYLGLVRHRNGAGTYASLVFDDIKLYNRRYIQP